MVFFTADQHFGHWAINSYCSRGFDSVEEMDETLIEAWNSVVGGEDVVYHLGDFCLGDYYTAERYIARLNGYIRFLRNRYHHDRNWMPSENDPSLMGSQSGYPCVFLPPIYNLEFPEYGDGKYPKTIVLCHFPIARWDKCHYQSWHLHGHSHGKYRPGEKVITPIRDIYLDLSLDIGVDVQKRGFPVLSRDWKPWSLVEVSKLFLHKQYLMEAKSENRN